MTTVSVHEAKTSLSKLVSAVERGEQVVIARAGKPVARLTAYHDPARAAASGFGGGRGSVLHLSDDFTAPDAAFEAVFHGPPVATPASDRADKPKSSGPRRKGSR